MLAKEIQKDLEEYYGARITAIMPYRAESDGEDEQFYEVHFNATFYVNVDEYGAVCGGREMKYAGPNGELYRG